MSGAAVRVLGGEDPIRSVGPHPRSPTWGPAEVGEELRQWLETMRAQVRESTWYGYRIAVDRLVEQLGEVRLQSLTPLQVETAYAKLRKDGGRYGGPLAPKTVRNCHIVLHRALVDAVRLDLVNRNVAGIARPPSVPRHEPVTWTAEELEAFLEHVSDDRLFPAYIVLATTGMRRGEVCCIEHTRSPSSRTTNAWVR